jgi:tetratricopeptide (TPR) repeat protein
MEAMHKDLEKRQSKLVEWSHLTVVNRNLAVGSKPAELIGYLEAIPLTRQSAVLTEKLADLYWAKGKLGDAVDTYETALKRGPSRQQTLRLLFESAEKRSLYGPDAKAYAHYETLLKEFPDYPDALKVYQLMLPVARRLNRPDEVARCEKEIKRLSPPPVPAKP